MGLFWARLLTLSGLSKIALGSWPLAKSFSISTAKLKANGQEPKAALLPPVMREGLIGFRHPVYIFLLLDRGALTRGRVQQFVGQLVDHTLFATGAGVCNQPANSQRGSAVGIHFYRHLIVRSTDSASLDLKQGLGVLYSLLEELQRFIAALLLHLRQRFIEDAFGGRALALPHHRVNKLCHQVRLIHDIGGYGSLCYFFLTEL